MHIVSEPNIEINSDISCGTVLFLENDMEPGENNCPVEGHCETNLYVVPRL